MAGSAGRGAAIGRFGQRQLWADSRARPDCSVTKPAVAQRDITEFGGNFLRVLWMSANDRSIARTSVSSSGISTAENGRDLTDQLLDGSDTDIQEDQR